MSRLDHWQEPRRVAPIMGRARTGAGEELLALAEARWREHGVELPPMSAALFRTAHEIIFESRDDRPVLTFVVRMFDPETFELVLSPALEMTDFEDAEDFKFQLALAFIHDVPVLANEPADAVELSEYYRSLMEVGLSRKDEAGRDVRLALTRYGERLGDAYEILTDLRQTETLTQGEAQLLQRALEERAEENAEAAALLAALRAAISDLGGLLDSDETTEEDLQQCLTRNPLLFGPQYKEVRPKHRFGSEYVADYALIRVSGLADVVEIEKSAYPLYTKSGNPSSQLTHAEQQVLDWLDWIERHGAYAREHLPIVGRPAGYIVIGRSASLDAQARSKLARRNASFGGDVEIMTFDDLLERGKSILALLTAAPSRVGRDGGDARR